MARKVFNMQGGNHSSAALSAFLDNAFDGDVADGMTVVPGSGNVVTVKSGTGQIRTGQGFSRLIQIDSNETVQLGAASPSNARYTLIVAFIDMAVQPTTGVIDNANDILKLKAIQGVPSSNPQDPSTSSIQSSVGASNPYIILARVKQRAASSSVVPSDITDLRKLVTVKSGRITADKMDFASFLLSYKERNTQIHVHGTTPQIVPELTSKVTVPAGVTKLRLCAYTPILYNEHVNVAAVMSIWKGQPNSGTKLQECRSFQSGGSGTGSPTASRIVTVSPGESLTFTVSLHGGSSSWTKCESTTDAPMYLSVEAVG